jgi:hypothetical protein
MWRRLSNTSKPLPPASHLLQPAPIVGKKVWPAGMQRDFSTFSIVSKETADTKWENLGSKSSLVMAPQFKFGM